MMTRELKDSDIPILRAMAQESGYPYPSADDPLLKAVIVVVDEEDQPMYAAALEPILQAYLWCRKGRGTPFESLAALRLLHEKLLESKPEGFTEINTFIKPQLAVQFGRRLERSFGWRRNWPSWFKKI